MRSFTSHPHSSRGVLPRPSCAGSCGLSVILLVVLAGLVRGLQKWEVGGIPWK